MFLSLFGELGFILFRLRIWGFGIMIWGRVSEWCGEYDVDGWRSFRYMNKSKYVKGKLKEWNVGVFGDVKVM